MRQRLRSCNAFFTSLRSMAVLADVLLIGEDTKAGAARAKEQQNRKKNSRCSRPNLLTVSLPSAAFTLRAHFFF